MLAGYNRAARLLAQKRRRDLATDKNALADRKPIAKKSSEDASAKTRANRSAATAATLADGTTRMQIAKQYDRERTCARAPMGGERASRRCNKSCNAIEANASAFARVKP